MIRWPDWRPLDIEQVRRRDGKLEVYVVIRWDRLAIIAGCALLVWAVLR